MLLLLLVLACKPSGKHEVEEDKSSVQADFRVDTVNILTERKLEMTKAYCEQNYGFDDYKLDWPQMIVVHYTVIPTLEQTLALFKQDSLVTQRKYIGQFSPLNVGIHYVVDKDGSIYSLMPDSVIARHIIGFNHVSIGIENIAANADDLTSDQLRSNAKLIHFLSERYTSINHLIGHHEYNDSTLAHYSLFKSLDKNYQPYDKPDPGEAFMQDLRTALKQRYELEFNR